MAKIILTGDRPTGRLHVGHYVGSLRRKWNYRIRESLIRFYYDCGCTGADRQF